MPETKHKPLSEIINLPVDVDQTCNNCLAIVDGDGMKVIELISDFDDCTPEDHEVANAIKRAINAHDALVDSARKVRSFYNNGGDSPVERLELAKLTDLALECVELD